MVLVNVLREALLPTALQTNLLEQFANDTMNIGEMSKLQPYTKVNGISLEFSNMTRGPEISCYIYDRWEKVIQMTCHHLDKWFWLRYLAIFFKKIWGGKGGIIIYTWIIYILYQYAIFQNESGMILVDMWLINIQFYVKINSYSVLATRKSPISLIFYTRVRLVVIAK